MTVTLTLYGPSQEAPAAKAIIGPPGPSTVEAQEAADRAEEARDEAEAVVATLASPVFAAPPPARLIAPAAMASPPTVTAGASTAGGTLTRTWWTGTSSSSWYLPSQPYGDHFAYARTLIGSGTALGSIPMVGLGVWNSVLTSSTGTDRGSAAFQASFFHFGEMLELKFTNTSNHYMVRVDGEFVSLTPVSTSNTFYKLAFPSRAVRRIDVIGGILAFNGVNTEPQDTLFAAPIRGPRVIVLGDSFTQPNANNGWNWVAKFAHIMGWDDVWSMGVGGTGYVATNSGNSKTFGDRLASDVLAYAPDICIVLGGINDGINSASAGSNAAALVSAFRSALPDSLLIGAYNCGKGIDTLLSGQLDTMDAIRQAFAAGGAQWCNPCELSLHYAGGAVASSTLTVSHASGRAGNTGTQGTASASTGIRCVAASGQGVNLRVGSTVEIGTGATRERKVINGLTQIGANDAAYAFDGALQYTHSAGETVKEVGPSYLTGRGRVGATTGWGNADVLTSADGTHPSDDGATALAFAMAGLVSDKITALRAAAA